MTNQASQGNTEEGSTRGFLGALRLSWFNKLFMVLNLVAIAALLVSYFAPYVSPQPFWYIATFGLGFPLLFLVNLLFVLYWLIQGRKRFLLSLIVLALGYKHISHFVTFNLSNAPEQTNSNQRFKVLTYNTKLFDLYNWSHNTETRGKMLELLKDEAAQLLCLQEFYHSDKPPFNNIDTLVKLLDIPYYHVEYTTTLRNRDHWGIATFSKYPIVRKGRIQFHTRTNNICIYTDLKIGRDTIRVYNLHLQSIQFDYKDYQFVDDLINNKETKQLEGSRNILRRIKLAFLKRASQVDLVLEHVKTSPYPVLVCGDFNDTPVSYTYRSFTDLLNDAFVEAGNGLGTTYVGRFPSVRIDYIFYDPRFSVYDFTTIREPYSDHYPLTTLVEMGGRDSAATKPQ